MPTPRTMAWRQLDFDAGVVSIPATSVWTEAFSMTINSEFFWEAARITVYDAAAIPVLRWRALHNGQPVGPYSEQRKFSYLAQLQEALLNEWMHRLEKLSIEVINGGGVAFDVVASIRGRETR